MAEDTQKTWIQEANRLLRKNPELTKKEVETLLSKQGKDKPTGIESGGSRSFKKKTRSTGQRQRRKAQEQVSTEAASEYTKTQRRLMQEDLGIAEYAGLDKPFFEHKYSQDVSGLLEEGAPGDYVARFPERESALKTEAERVSRQNFGNKFAIVNTATDLKAVPVEAFSELIDPEDLPGFKIDPDIPLKEQFSAATQVDFKGGVARLKGAGSVVPILGIGATAVLASQQAMAGDLSEAAFTVGTGVIGEVPVVGDVAAEFIEGTPVASGELTPAKADPQAYVKQALQEKAQRGKEFSEFVQLAKQRPSTTVNPKELERQRRAEEARQQGGKVKFAFGGVKFTLPEFGLSELMGLN